MWNIILFTFSIHPTYTLIPCGKMLISLTLHYCLYINVSTHLMFLIAKSWWHVWQNIFPSLQTIFYTTFDVNISIVQNRQCVRIDIFIVYIFVTVFNFAYFFNFMCFAWHFFPCLSFSLYVSMKSYHAVM